MILLAENQTLTNTFTDIGLIIGSKQLSGSTKEDLINFSFLTVAVELNINDSKDFQIRALAVDEKDNVEFTFPIETTKKDKTLIEPALQELNVDTDTNQLFEFELDDTIDAVQLQVRVGTVGATAGIVTSLRYNKGYRQ